MNVINLSNPLYTPSSSAGDGVAAGPVGVSAGDGISMQDNLSPVVAAAPGAVDWNQIANQADAEQLQEADALVADAYGRVFGGACPVNQYYAQSEMAQASAIRQSVILDIHARYSPDDSYPLEVQIGTADEEESQGFNAIQSSDPTDQSNGLTDLWAGTNSMLQLEANLRG
jgi:hypothetical protein